MPDTLDERVADLEQLVLRQAEPISALEERLDTAHHILTTRMLREIKSPKDEVA